MGGTFLSNAQGVDSRNRNRHAHHCVLGRASHWVHIQSHSLHTFLLDYPHFGVKVLDERL